MSQVTHAAPCIGNAGCKCLEDLFGADPSVPPHQKLLRLQERWKRKPDSIGELAVPLFVVDTPDVVGFEDAHGSCLKYNTDGMHVLT